VVCQAIELETGTLARDYIQLHRGDAKLLLEILNYIRLAAGRILLGILENQNLPEGRAALDLKTRRISTSSAKFVPRANVPM
jgi:hypothetical protein